MTEQEWLDRYEQHFIERGVDAATARASRTAESFGVLSDTFEDDPEGAADEEMSYWDGE